jgi:DUF4097 and DUF4098 domain-containing protein YvlB
MRTSISLVVTLLSLTYSFAQNLIAFAELEAENIDNVSIEASWLDVDIRKGDVVYFKGEIYGNGEEGDYEFRSEIVGRTIEIELVSNRSDNWRSRKIKNSGITVQLPEGVSVDIDNSSGDISVYYLDCESSKLETSSGDISVSGAKANLQMEASSGDIEVTNLIGNLEIETTSGDQKLYGTRGTINTRATSGDISIKDFDGNIKLQASSGDVVIENGTGAVAVRTTSGNIDGYSIELVGDARFDASSGDVDIRFKNDLESLSFDLTATSGDLEVGNRRADKRLTLQRGGYLVTGITSSGDQEYNN